MNYDRFSSWADDEDDDITPDVESAVEPVAEPKPAASDSPEDIIEMLSCLEDGEAVSIDVDIDTFNAVYKTARKSGDFNNLPSYADGKLVYTKG
jgi:hypothetical protein